MRQAVKQGHSCACPASRQPPSRRKTDREPSPRPPAIRRIAPEGRISPAPAPGDQPRKQTTSIATSGWRWAEIDWVSFALLLQRLASQGLAGFPDFLFRQSDRTNQESKQRRLPQVVGDGLKLTGYHLPFSFSVLLRRALRASRISCSVSQIGPTKKANNVDCHKWLAMG